MIIVTKSNVDDEQISVIRGKLESFGLEATVLSSSSRKIIGVLGDVKQVSKTLFLALPGVEKVLSVSKPYQLVSREFKRENTIVHVKGVPIGGGAIQIIAGPCSVETSEQMQASAAAVTSAGALLMRGGAFKPRTSPYTFQGHGETGLQYLLEAARSYDLPVVTELLDVRDLDKFLQHKVDVIQIGTRNMQNFQLLKEVGRLDIPVILKRGMSATVKEWLMAAEYVASAGNMNIILAERGIRTFENAYRNVLDVSAIPFLKRETHLPVIVDPSHAGGYSWMVPALSLAAIAAGADGLLIECHPSPAEAWSDAEQALSPQELEELVQDIRAIASAKGRVLGEKTVQASTPLLSKTSRQMSALN
jgi:3-deoxy-7-phosphoheptulonate synthase